MLSFDYSKKFMKDNFNTCTTLGFNPCRDIHNYNRKISTYPSVPPIPDWRDNFPAALRSEFKEIPSGMNVCGTTVQYTYSDKPPPTEAEQKKQEEDKQIYLDYLRNIDKQEADNKYSYSSDGSPG